jgi:hypothetical protein
VVVCAYKTLPADQILAVTFAPTWTWQ